MKIKISNLERQNDLVNLSTTELDRIKASGIGDFVVNGIRDAFQTGVETHQLRNQFFQNLINPAPLNNPTSNSTPAGDFVNADDFSFGTTTGITL